MNKIFITGDKHGEYTDLSHKLVKANADANDVCIILGDHGTLYYDDAGSDRKKALLAMNLPTFICLHGNHDRRPDCAAFDHEFLDIETPLYAGQFYRDKKRPTILYTKEYGWYRFGSKMVFVIGGAYSIDKYRRFDMQKMGMSSYLWFSDEQLFPRERAEAQNMLKRAVLDLESDDFYIMSHTAPLKYLPHEVFISGIDQSKVDQTMEKWMDTLELDLPYVKWYAGHFHADKTIDRMHFMYNDLVLFDELNQEVTKE